MSFSNTQYAGRNNSPHGYGGAWSEENVCTGCNEHTRVCRDAWVNGRCLACVPLRCQHFEEPVEFNDSPSVWDGGQKTSASAATSRKECT